MDPFDCFSDSKLVHFQLIFNIFQQYHGRTKHFEIRTTEEFQRHHLPTATLVPLEIFTGSIRLSDISRFTDTSKLRRQCIIISFSECLQPQAEILRKLLLRNKCKEIHMLGDIEEFIERYSFLIDDHRVKEYPNEMIPNFLYLGSEEQAHNAHIIQNLKITHIVNATKSSPNKFHEIKYCKVTVADQEDEKISRFFQKAYCFIESAMHENQLGAKNVVLVHCAHGVSRSATLVVMFLMRTFGMSLENSMKHVKKHRNKAEPNPGFIKQLEEFYCNRFKFSRSFAGNLILQLEE
ncbi:hypothetical protein SteCoe_13622 [Stentor coeruleus]|uniref:protein-tyrosine-phosphatase n=1 Tax=Stentor coeruleus TaxID=5963 RepID=A0A1R2C7X4_9CILI|nr:hypothetical protein SteCoe_13622 [Stentor coeruleus]